MADEKDDAEQVADKLLVHMDIERVAQDTGLSVDKVERLWKRHRRRLAKKSLTEAAARDFVAEADEVLARVSQVLYESITHYSGGPDKLNGLASVGKQFKDITAFRILMRQDLALIPTTRMPAKQPGRPTATPEPLLTSVALEPPPPPPEAPVDEATLEADIAMLQAELARVRARQA